MINILYGIKVFLLGNFLSYMILDKKYQLAFDHTIFQSLKLSTKVLKY